MNLRWTDAGRAALAAKAHVGTAAVKLTHVAIGDGSGAGGAGDDSRTALRSERHRAALAGQAATGKIAARADFNPDASYGITEAGIFGTAGDPPNDPPELYLYWTDGGREAGKAADGTALAIAAVIEFQDSAADVKVTVGGNVVFGTVDQATAAAFGSTRYATAAETGDGTAEDRALTPKGLHGGIAKVLAAASAKTPVDGTIYQLEGTAAAGLAVKKRTLPGATTLQKGIVELATADEAKKGADTDRAVTPAGLKSAIAGKADSSDLPGNASATKRGIVELASDAEAKKGADTSRAVTPKALKAAAPGLALAGVPAAGATEKTYVIKRATSAKGGGLAFVEAVFRRYVTPGVHAFTVPAGVTRLRATLIGAGGGGAGGRSCQEEEDRGEDGGSHFAGCSLGTPGGSGGRSAIVQGSATLASAAGGAGGSGTHRSKQTPGAGRALAGATYGAGGVAGMPAYGNGGLREPGAGGSGAMTVETIAVTPGEPLKITVGRSGAGGGAGVLPGIPNAVNLDFGTAGSGGGHGAVQLVNA